MTLPRHPSSTEKTIRQLQMNSIDLKSTIIEPSILLDGPNFFEWAEALENRLAAIGCRRVLSEDFQATSPADLEADDKAWAMIKGSMHPKVKPHFADIKTASGILERGSKLFGGKDSSVARSYYDKLNAYKFVQGGIAKS